MGRKPLVRGRRHTIFPAIRADSTEPAIIFLDELRRKVWRPDSDHTPGSGWPDDQQETDHHSMMELLRRYADRGTGFKLKDINRLDHGIWEFKIRRKRLSYYDTDGHGNTSDRPKLQHPSQCTRGQLDPCWFVPDFDRQIRVGHAFPKRTDQTLKSDIHETLQVREEDLRRDRAA